MGGAMEEGAAGDFVAGVLEGEGQWSVWLWEERV
jgi:hypothetical protein